MQSIQFPINGSPVSTIDPNANVNQIIAGTDISTTNGGNGIVVVSDTSTLASVTGRGNTTANIVLFTGGANVTGGVLNVAGNLVAGNSSYQNTNVATTLNVASNLLTQNIVVTGVANIALDPTTYVFEEDFTSIAPTGAVGSASAIAFEHKWTCANIGTAANEQIQQGNPADGLHMGIVSLTCTNTTSGNGLAIYLGGGAKAAGFINPNSNVFVYKTAFQLSGAATVGAYLGFTSNSAQTSVPNANTILFCGLRYDTSVNDANLMFIGQTAGAVGNTWKDSGVPADANWHKLIMKGFANGSVTFQLDGNATIATVSTIPSALMDFGTMQIVARSTTNPTLNVDYLQFMVTGLNR